MRQDKEKVSLFLKKEKTFLSYLCCKPKQKQELCIDMFTSLSTKTCPKLNRVVFCSCRHVLGTLKYVQCNINVNKYV